MRSAGVGSAIRRGERCDSTREGVEGLDAGEEGRSDRGGESDVGGFECREVYIASSRCFAPLTPLRGAPDVRVLRMTRLWWVEVGGRRESASLTRELCGI